MRLASMRPRHFSVKGLAQGMSDVYPSACVSVTGRGAIPHWRYGSAHAVPEPANQPLDGGPTRCESGANGIVRMKVTESTSFLR